MISIDIDVDNFNIGPRWVAAHLFPENSVILSRTPFTLRNITWENFFAACKKIQQQFSTVDYVFIDATWDPVHPDHAEMAQRRQELAEIFPRSKIVVLSARVQHFYDNLPGVLYVPFFAMCRYPDLEFLPKKGRFGCLNRRPGLHRLRLMYHLLDEKLMDADRDVFSVNFVNLYSDKPYNFYLSGYEWMAQKLRDWPPHMATHPDGFPNDYSISHPAWHTGIVIITETMPDDQTIVCEKTAKGILSKSCFSIYMADVGYQMLEDLGFEPRFFDDHPEYENIQPALDLCRRIQTEREALDYRQQHIAQIEHNFEWFGIETPNFWQRPWFAKYEPKLKAFMSSL
jgi:hypothetical protein